MILGYLNSRMLESFVILYFYLPFFTLLFYSGTLKTIDVYRCGQMTANDSKKHSKVSKLCLVVIKTQSKTRRAPKLVMHRRRSYYT